MKQGIWAPTLAAAGAALAFAAAVAVWQGPAFFPLDDPYIVQHSVSGLLRGAETRYAGSSPMTGATSPVQIILIAALAWLIPTSLAQLIVVALSAAVYITGCFHLALRSGARPPWATAVAVLSVLAGISFFQLFNGLETGLAMAVVAWSLIWFFDSVPVHAWRYALLGVLPYVRPELAVLSLLLLMRAAATEWTANREAFVSTMLRAAAWIAAGAAPVALFLVANGQSILPNTVSAKAYFFAEGCLPLVHKQLVTFTLVGEFLTALGLAGLGFVAMAYSRFRWVGLAFVVTVLVAYALSLPGALLHNHFRYVHILVPFAIAGWASVVASGNLRLRRAGQAGLALALVVAAAGFGNALKLYSDGLTFARDESRGVSDWVERNVSEDAVILVHDAGYISNHGSQKLVDIVGLKTPSSIEAHRKFTWNTCRRNPDAIDQIATESGAGYIVVLKEWDDRFRFTGGLRARGWRVDRVDGERGDAALYQVYSIER